MKRKISESAGITPARTLHNAALRVFDIGLAIALGALAAPLLASVLPGAAIRKVHYRGRDNERFETIEIDAAPGIRHWLSTRLRIGRSPVLLNILRGNMAWVGPRPLAPDERPPSHLRTLRASVRPGIFSLWWLRQRTHIDYGDEWTTDAEQIASRSLFHDLGLFLRCLLASIYGSVPPQEGRDPVLVDTVQVHPVTMEETLERIDQQRSAARANPLQICFVNPACVNIARRTPAYRRAVNRAGLVAPDGIGMRIAGKILGRGFRQNVNGTDLFPRLCERLSRNGGRLYLLGGRPGVAEDVASWVAKNHPGVQVAGLQHGYFDATEQDAVIEKIRNSEADVLLVAMGVPRQDLWIQEHARQTGAPVVMGVGGLFDFYANRIPRAPQWLREIGLEWTFRLYQEPRRMWRRYLLGNFSFLTAVLLQRWLGGVDPHLLETQSDQHPIQPSAQRALLIAAPAPHGGWTAATDMNPVMLPLGDRPLLYRQMETLAGLGCNEVEVFASQGLEDIRKLLGSGDRWGLRVAIHAVRDFADARRRIGHSPLGADEGVWLARADHWLPATALQGAPENAAWFSPESEGRLRWAGWACVTGRQRAALLATMGPDELCPENLPQGMSRIGTTTAFRFDAGPAALDAQRRWLARTPDRFELLPEALPGIRVAPSARVADGVRLIAPVEVGENTRIAAGSRLGPNVVVGEGSRIEGETVIRDTLIADGVHIQGPAEVRQAIVTPHGLLHTAYDVWLASEATGDLLGTTTAAPASPDVAVSERLAALATLVLGTLPVLTLRMLGRGQDFSLRVFPQLYSVVRGQRALIGMAGQSEWPQSIHAAGWIEALRTAPQGLVRPGDALGLTDPDAAAWADVHWLLHAGWRERMRLLLAYFRATSSQRFTVTSQSQR